MKVFRGFEPGDSSVEGMKSVFVPVRGYLSMNENSNEMNVYYLKRIITKINIFRDYIQFPYYEFLNNYLDLSVRD